MPDTSAQMQVVVILFIVLIALVILVYGCGWVYITTTKNQTISFKEGLQRSMEAKHRQQMLVDLENKITHKK